MFDELEVSGEHYLTTRSWVTTSRRRAWDMIPFLAGCAMKHYTWVYAHGVYSAACLCYASSVLTRFARPRMAPHPGMHTRDMCTVGI